MRDMAGHVLEQLAHPDEYEPSGGGLLVERFRPDDERYPGAECFKVSFGGRDGWRTVEVEVVPTSEQAMSKSMAWAAWQVADAFQDEVIELLRGDPRPPCPGHAHPMVPRIADTQAWWECPSQPKERRPLWPIERT